MQAIQKLLAAVVLGLALSGCGGGGSGNGNATGPGDDPPVTPAPSNNFGAVAATGGPLANVPFRITQLNGTELLAGQVNNQAHIDVLLDLKQVPFLVEVTDTGVTPAKTYQSLVLPSDVVDGKVALNVTPLSTLVWQVVNNSRSADTTPSALQSLRNDAADAVLLAISPLLSAAGANIPSGAALLSKVFVPLSDPFDKVLDSLWVDCNPSDKTCTLQPVSGSIRSQLSPALVVDTSSLAKAQASAQKIQTQLAALPELKTRLFDKTPVVVFSVESQWGTARDSWAGYTGKFAIYNFSDQALDGAAQLYFESQQLKAQGFWGVTPNVQAPRYAFTLPQWVSIPPRNIKNAPQSYAFGFTGQGLPSTVTDFSSCNLNGQKCIVVIDDGAPVLAGADAITPTRSWVQFLASMVNPEAKPIATLPPVTVNPQDNTVRSGDLPNRNTSAQVVLASTSQWEGGFNGELRLTNTSQTDWTSWRLSLTLPSGVTAIGSWGNYKLDTTGNSATFSNETWNGALANSSTLKLGFGGVGALGDGPSGAAGGNPSNSALTCSISFDGKAALPCTASLASANTPPAAAPAAQPPAPPPSPAANLPSTPNTPPAANSDEPSTIAASVMANQTRRSFVGYYPSWSDNWFSSKDWSGKDLSDDQILSASKLARVPGTYTHVVLAFANPNLSWFRIINFLGNTWDGSGLNFNAQPLDIKRVIDVLHKRNIKVLLAVGGATYNDWGPMAAENGNPGGPIVNSLMKIMLDLGLDGLEIDYEVDDLNITQYMGIVNSMRMAVDRAGGGRILSLAGWSTGADCTRLSGTNACGGATSFWGGRAGRERLVFSDPAFAAKINMVNVMSYDARFENYDGVKAWQLYRDVFPKTTIVNIGLETAPEGWAGGMLVVDDADAQCTGATLLKDQFGTSLNQPYSVNRYASAVTTSRPNSHPRDGAMLWQILKTANASCGTATVASPGTVAKKISTLYGLPADDRSQWK